MAKQNLQNALGSSKGRDSDFDFDFDDRDSPFANLDVGAFGDTNSKNNRDPIQQTKQGVSAALSSAYASFIPGLSDRISQSIPEAAKFSGELGTFTSDVMYMGTKLQQDIAPTISQLKRAGRTLAPRVKQFLPKFAQKKYDSLMSDTDDRAQQNAKINKEATESSAIAASIDSIFTAQLNAQSEVVADQKADTMLDRALTSKRHSESFQQLQAIRAGATFHQTFIQNIQIPFMKKDLELKYRHFFVARDTLAVMQGLAKITEQKLEQIRHNSSLPDIQKMTKWEGVKEAGLQRFGNVITNWQTNMLRKLQSRVLDPFKEGLSMAGDTAEMISDVTETMDSMNGVQGVGAQTGSLVGMGAGSYLSKKAGKFLFGEKYGSKGLLSNKAMSIDNLFRNLKTRTALKVQDLAEEREGTFMGELLSLISPDIGRRGGSTTNTMLKDPDAVAPFSNAVSLSITTIMPGYMARMVKLLEEIKTGEPADELVFDRESNDFITTSTLRKKFAVEAFGTTSTRQARMTTAIGTMRGVYKAETGDDNLASFDECIPDLLIFINNSATAKYSLRPAVIREFAGIIKEAQANDEDDFDIFDDTTASENAMRYMRICFKGIKHTEELCILLTSLLYDSNGNLDKSTYSTLDNVIIDQMAHDGHLETINKYIGKLGHARHLKGMFTSSGGKFTHDEEAIRSSILSGVNIKSESFRRELSSQTDRTAVTQAEFKQEVSFKDMINDPEWNSGVLGKIISGTKKMVGDHESGAINMISDWKGGIKEAWEQDILPAVPKEIVEWSKKWAPKAHLKIQELNDSVKDTMNDASKKAELKLRHARLKEERANISSSEFQDLDPFFKRGNTISKMTASAAQQMPRGMNPYAIAALTGSPTGFQFPVISPSKNDEIVPVRLTNYDEVVNAFEKIIKTSSAVTTTSNSIMDGSTTDAVRQFENTFKEYAEKQSAIPELLNKLLDISGAMSSQLDGLIGNTTGTVKKAFGWVKNHGWDFVKKVPGAAINLPWNMTKWTGKQTGKALGYGWNKAGQAKDWAMQQFPGAWNATKQGIGTAAGLAGSAISGAAGLTGSAVMGGLSGLGLTSDLLAGKLATGAQWFRDKKDNFKTGIGGLRKSVGTAWKKKVFIDIYLKDKIDPGKPLLSKNKQMEGVYFVDGGKKLLTTYALSKPVMDGETKDVLVTQQDIEHGLVDVDNRSIYGAKSLAGKMLSGSIGLIGKGLSKGKDFLKDVMEGKNPLLGLYGKALGLGLDGIRSAGRGAGFMLKKIFGVSEGINAEDLKKHVGDKLDVIIALLEKKFSGPNGAASENDSTGSDAQHRGGTRPGDEDGDGNKDSIFEVRKKSQEAKQEKEENKEKRGFYATMKSIRDKLSGEKKEKKGFLASLMGIFGMGGLLGVAKNIFSTLGMIGTGIFGILKFVGNIGGLLMNVIPSVGKAISWGLDKATDFFSGRTPPTLGGAGGKSFLGKLTGFLGKTGVTGGVLGAAATLATGGSMGDAAINAGIGAASDIAIRSVTGAGLRAAGGMLMRGAGSVIGGILGAKAAVVIGAAALTASAADHLFFGGKYSQHVFNYVGIGTDAFVEDRCKLYGVDTSFKFMNVFGGSTLRQVIKLEEETYAIGEGTETPLSDRAIEKWTNHFDLDNGDPQQIKFWVTWYKRRFLPIFKLYCAALQKEGINFKNAYDMSTELKNKILGQVHGEASTIIKSCEGLVPTPAAYKEFKKKYDERKGDKSEGTTAENQKALANADAANEKSKGSVKNSEKYNLSASEAGALDAATSTKYEKPEWSDFATGMAGNDPELLRMMGGSANKKASGVGSINGFPVLPGTAGAAGTATGATPGGQPGGPIDMSGIPPSANAPQGSGEIGSYVAKYESGKKGSAAIGYDSTGGTSYGTYQLSSRAGSLKEFVNWCSKEAPDVYKTLAPLLGQANTGSKTGAFPQAWVDLVKQGKITHELEYKYYIDKFYGYGMRLLQKENPGAAQLVAGNRALQEAMWSTSVQHGPDGARKLFSRNFKPGITPEDYLRALYADRGTQFPSSTASVRASVQRRFKNELADMLALNQSKGGPADPNKQADNGEGPPEGAVNASGDVAGASKSEQKKTDGGGTVDQTSGVSQSSDTVTVKTESSPGAMANTEIGGGGGQSTSTSGGTASMASSHSASTSTTDTVATTTPSPPTSGGEMLKLVSTIADSLTKLVEASQQTPGLLEKLIEIGTGFTTAKSTGGGSTTPSQQSAINRPDPFTSNISTAKLRRA